MWRLKWGSHRIILTGSCKLHNMDNYSTLIELKNLHMSHVTCLCVYGINTCQIISVQYHIRNTNISVRFFRSSGMLCIYVCSPLPMFRDSLPVQSSRVSHPSWTELPDWVSLNVDKQVRMYAIPQQRKPQPHRCASLKSSTLFR